MISADIISRLKRFREFLEESPFMDILRSNAHTYDSMQRSLGETLFPLTRENLTAAQSTMIDKLGVATKEILQLSPASIFRYFSLFENEIEAAKLVFLLNDELDAGIGREMDLELNVGSVWSEARLAYDTYLTSHLASDLWRLLRAWNRLEAVLTSVDRTLAKIELMLRTKTTKTGDNYDTITLVVPGNATLRGTIERLIAIETTYNEFCKLLRISSDEYPLVAEKIETDCLFTKLFGQSKVIAAVTDFMRESASILRSKYTQRGKLEENVRKMGYLEAGAKAAQALKKVGCDTSDMTEELAESGKILFEQQRTLLSGDESVRINDETFDSHSSRTDQFTLPSIPTMKILTLSTESEDPKLLGTGDDEGDV